MDEDERELFRKAMRRAATPPTAHRRRSGRVPASRAPNAKINLRGLKAVDVALTLHGFLAEAPHHRARMLRVIQGP